MPFKINISEKGGKTYKLELDSEAIIGKNLGDTIAGEEISPDLAGYELEITGTSDKSGFTSMKNVEGIGLKKILLSYGKGMKTRPKKEGKKKRSDVSPKGLRLRKTVRGKTISPDITQINVKVVKEGGKKLSEIFPATEKAPKENRKAKRLQKAAEAKAAEESAKVEEVDVKENAEVKEGANPEEEPTANEPPKQGIEEAKE